MQRSPSGVALDDQSSRDVAVRRAAARALARIGSPATRPGLVRALADEDEEVLAWSAYGLGVTCETTRDETVSALVARAIELPDAPAQKDAVPPARAFDAFGAIARAVGKCNGSASEPTLVAWLGASKHRAELASLALGDLASQKKRLREETIATLLTLAAGSASVPAIPEALYPLSRVDNVPPSVVQRLLDVATGRLVEASPYRLFAIRALSRAKAAAAPHLARVLLGKDTFTSPERIEAARSLSRLGEDGDAALAGALKQLAPHSDAVARGGDDFDVPMAAVISLKSVRDAKDVLTTIAGLAAPPPGNAAGQRRVSQLRCAAAKLLAGSTFTDPTLVACDLDKGTFGKLALVDVIGRAELSGPRLDAWKKLLDDPEARVREAALGLLGAHSEVVDSATILVNALGAKESGVVATAADQIASAPRLVGAKRTAKAHPKAGEKTKSKPAGKDEDADKEMLGPPVPEVVVALRAALDRAEKEGDLELEGAVIDAVGALALKEVEPRLNELCASTYPTTREHASSALALLAGKKHACPAPDSAGLLPPELDPAKSGGGALGSVKSTTLVFASDAGELRMTLDPALAPVAVARFVELARSGYYDGNVIHRVDAAFVVQLGSPHGDGYGGPEGRPPLRCETSPLPFDTLSVGVALAGRDTGSSQLFVMRARHPHLDGLYAIVGQAAGPWDLVSEGDTIRSVKVE